MKKLLERIFLTIGSATAKACVILTGKHAVETLKSGVSVFQQRKRVSCPVYFQHVLISSFGEAGRLISGGDATVNIKAK